MEALGKLKRICTAVDHEQQILYSPHAQSLRHVPAQPSPARGSFAVSSNILDRIPCTGSSSIKSPALYWRWGWLSWRALEQPLAIVTATGGRAWPAGEVENRWEGSRLRVGLRRSIRIQSSPSRPSPSLPLRWQRTQSSRLRMPSSSCSARMFAGVCAWQP